MTTTVNADIPNIQWPPWAIRKIGEPLLTEADWNYPSFPNTKFGMFADGTGSIGRDEVNLRFGGEGSIRMITDATSGHNSEIKATIQGILKQGDLLAFEQKWAQNFASAGTAFDMGIESRDNVNILQGRFRYSITNGDWQYEQSGPSFTQFPSSIGGDLVITSKPVISQTVGTYPGWARAVIDPWNRLYVGFEAGTTQGIQTRDMRSLAVPLTANGSSGGVPLYLFFTIINAGSNSAEPAYTTDWAISRIPAGMSPF